MKRETDYFIKRVNEETWAKGVSTFHLFVSPDFSDLLGVIEPDWLDGNCVNVETDFMLDLGTVRVRSEDKKEFEFVAVDALTAMKNALDQGIK
jgi:hypothetical protein